MVEIIFHVSKGKKNCKKKKNFEKKTNNDQKERFYRILETYEFLKF